MTTSDYTLMRELVEDDIGDALEVTLEALEFPRTAAAMRHVFEALVAVVSLARATILRESVHRTFAAPRNPTGSSEE